MNETEDAQHNASSPRLANGLGQLLSQPGEAYWTGNGSPTPSQQAAGAPRKQPWSEDESKALALLHLQFGNRWSSIARLIPGRTENDIKNLWHSTLRGKNILRDSLLLAYARATKDQPDDLEGRQRAFAHAQQLCSVDTSAGGSGCGSGSSSNETRPVPSVPPAAGQQHNNSSLTHPHITPQHFAVAADRAHGEGPFSPGLSVGFVARPHSSGSAAGHSNQPSHTPNTVVGATQAGEVFAQLQLRHSSSPIPQPGSSGLRSRLLTSLLQQGPVPVRTASQQPAYVTAVNTSASGESAGDTGYLLRRTASAVHALDYGSRMIVLDLSEPGGADEEAACRPSPLVSVHGVTAAGRRIGGGNGDSGGQSGGGGGGGGSGDATAVHIEAGGDWLGDTVFSSAAAMAAATAAAAAAKASTSAASAAVVAAATVQATQSYETAGVNHLRDVGAFSRLVGGGGSGDGGGGDGGGGLGSGGGNWAATAASVSLADADTLMADAVRATSSGPAHFLHPHPYPQQRSRFVSASSAGYTGDVVAAMDSAPAAPATIALLQMRPMGHSVQQYDCQVADGGASSPLLPPAPDVRGAADAVTTTTDACAGWAFPVAVTSALATWGGAGDRIAAALAPGSRLLPLVGTCSSFPTNERVRDISVTSAGELNFDALDEILGEYYDAMEVDEVSVPLHRQLTGEEQVRSEVQQAVAGMNPSQAWAEAFFSSQEQAQARRMDIRALDAGPGSAVSRSFTQGPQPQPQPQLSPLSQPLQMQPQQQQQPQQPSRPLEGNPQRQLRGPPAIPFSVTASGVNIVDISGLAFNNAGHSASYQLPAARSSSIIWTGGVAGPNSSSHNNSSSYNHQDHHNNNNGNLKITSNDGDNPNCPVLALDQLTAAHHAHAKSSSHVVSFVEGLDGTAVRAAGSGMVSGLGVCIGGAGFSDQGLLQLGFCSSLRLPAATDAATTMGLGQDDLEAVFAGLEPPVGGRG